MPHWPQEQAHAFLLRVTRAALYEGFTDVGDDLRPDRVVTADLVRDHVDLPDFTAPTCYSPQARRRFIWGTRLRC